jgi:bacterioferritin-associated ferredoxin
VYVCICRAVRARTITTLIDSGADVSQIERVTGAGTMCGSCRATVAEMVRVAASPAPSHPTPTDPRPSDPTREDGPR